MIRHTEFDDLPGNDEALYTSPQVAPKVKLFLLQNGWTLGILSGDTLNTCVTHDGALRSPRRRSE